MAVVTVSGVVLWTKHIHGDPSLREALGRLLGGDEIELVVDGVRGHWRKMANGKDGRPTPGLQPRGRMQAFWRDLNRTKRGEDVRVEPISSDQPTTACPTQAERQAALERLLALDLGPLLDGWRFSRQEVYDERDDELEARRLAQR